MAKLRSPLLLAQMYQQSNEAGVYSIVANCMEINFNIVNICEYAILLLGQPSILLFSSPL